MTKDLTNDITSAVNATWNAFGRRWWADLDADDAKQTAFMACWQVRERYDPERSAPTTFFSLVARQAIRRLRDKEAAAAAAASLSVPAFEDGTDFANLIEAPEERPWAEINEESDMLTQAMGETLTASENETLMGLLDGMSVTELAQLRGTSHQAVSKQRANGLSKLREALS